jgi:hypothetical protein
VTRPRMAEGRLARAAIGVVAVVLALVMLLGSFL